MAALMRVHTSQKGAQDMRMFSRPCLSFLPLLSLSALLPQVFPFIKLITFGYDLHFLIIQNLCLHLSRSTPLRKTLTVNHYLRSEYFQHFFLSLGSVAYELDTTRSSWLGEGFSSVGANIFLLLEECGSGLLGA